MSLIKILQGVHAVIAAWLLQPQAAGSMWRIPVNEVQAGQSAGLIGSWAGQHTESRTGQVAELLLREDVMEPAYLESIDTVTL